MKTSKAYFNRFKCEFLRMQRLLGLTQYRAYFQHKKLNGSWATLYVQEQSKVATVTLNLELKSDDKAFDDGAESHARHEALHLLFHRLCFLGQERWTGSDEITDEAEAVVVRLENFLENEKAI
jgi:hypothetical protein